ncbi:MAG: OmpA family protein [Chitinophagales bacterium]
MNASKSNNTHPAVAESEGDFDILYFSSDRNDGEGGYDIYYAEVGENGKVNSVNNLGPVINTSGNEKTPLYYAEHGLLYFSSDMHPGLGGFDNFSAEGSLQEWTEPVNLGYPINSSADDQFYAPGEDRRSYYFVSNRPGIIGLKSETCCDDIFMAKDLFVPDFAVKGKIKEQVDSTTTSPLKGVDIAIYSVENGKRALFAIDSNKNLTSYFHNLKAGKDFEMEFKKQGYFTFTESIQTKGVFESDTFEVDATLEKIRKDKSYTLSNIYYAYNSAELNEASKETLDQLYTILSENESLIFELSSHTDSIGSAGYNQRLSQKRAQACVDYLLEKGVSKDQLIAKGYGESQPIAPNTKPDGSDNPEGRAMNRRTEYKVIGEFEFEGDQVLFKEGQ